MERDFFMGPPEATEYGLIDTVISAATVRSRSSRPSCRWKPGFLRLAPVPAVALAVEWPWA